jgi:predicted RNase H-like HicB family nuclease
MKYHAVIEWIDDEYPYYFAYLPDFGISECNAIGPTIKSALNMLREVERNVKRYYEASGRKLPESTLTASY